MSEILRCSRDVSQTSRHILELGIIAPGISLLWTTMTTSFPALISPRIAFCTASISGCKSFTAGFCSTASNGRATHLYPRGSSFEITRPKISGVCHAPGCEDESWMSHIYEFDITVYSSQQNLTEIESSPLQYCCSLSIRTYITCCREGN